MILVYDQCVFFPLQALEFHLFSIFQIYVVSSAVLFVHHLENIVQD